MSTLLTDIRTAHDSRRWPCQDSFQNFRGVISASVVWIVVLSGGLALAQTLPANKDRQDVARQYLRRAQESLTVSKSPQIIDLGNGYVSRVQAALGNKTAAMQTLDAIHFRKVKAVADVARVEAQSGHPKEAITMLHDASAALGSKASNDDLGAIGTAEAELGDLEAARKIASGMDASSQRAMIYSAIARGMSKAGNVEGSNESLSEAGPSLTGLFEEHPVMQAGDIALEQYDLGDIEGARRTADKIFDPGQKLAVYAALGLRMANKGDKELAQEFLELGQNKVARLHNLINDARLFSTLAQGYAKLGDTGRASSLFDLACQAGARLDVQGEWRSQALVRVAIAQRASGDIKGARKTIDMALEPMSAMKSASHRTRAFWMIAALQAHDGDIDGAEKSVHEAVEGSMDPNKTALLAGIVAELIARAKGAQADFSWIDRLETPEAKGLAFGGAAVGMLEEVQPDNAHQ